MNDHFDSILDDLNTGGEELLDLGSFDGFDPFAGDDEPPESVALDSSPKKDEAALIAAPLPPSVQERPKQTDTPSVPEDSPSDNPLQQAVAQAEEKDAKQEAASLFVRPPVFCYGGVNEEITDKKMTFDQLREEKARDFSELEDASKVSWAVDYGKSLRIISKPKTEVIFAVKREIETSKAFLDALKKGDNKNLACMVKPKITAQKKGLVPYKGIFTDWEELKAVGKPISYLPAQDGRVYEIRRTELGAFIAPASGVEGLPQVQSGFRPALPPIPFSLFCQVVDFFRSFLQKGGEWEALVHIYWDKAEKRYLVSVPDQWVEKAAVDAVIHPGSGLDGDRYLHFADIHSHNTMEARFSLTDDLDEKATRVYIVVGRLDRYFPQVSARISCNGRFVPIPASQVISPLPQGFPSHWPDAVRLGRREERPVA